MKANVRQYAESLTAAYESGVKTPKELVLGLVSVLAKKGQTNLLKNILATLIETEAEKKGLASVTIESAATLEEPTKKKLLAEAQKLYPKSKIDADFTVNPDLLAGFRIRGKDRELDQSLKTSLAKFHNHLI